MGSAIPGQVALDSIRNQTEQAMEINRAKSTPPWPLHQLQVPALSPCADVPGWWTVNLAASGHGVLSWRWKPQLRQLTFLLCLTGLVCITQSHLCVHVTYTYVIVGHPLKI